MKLDFFNSWTGNYPLEFVLLDTFQYQDCLNILTTFELDYSISCTKSQKIFGPLTGNSYSSAKSTGRLRDDDDDDDDDDELFLWYGWP